jgi:hypothetical protein
VETKARINNLSFEFFRPLGLFESSRSGDFAIRVILNQLDFLTKKNKSRL